MGGWVGGGMGRGMGRGGGCGISSLMKQTIKGKNYAVFCFAEKKNIILYLCCDCEANHL
jgi:hypothetical protein